jgi:hypothetical protein
MIQLETIKLKNAIANPAQIFAYSAMRDTVSEGEE